MAAPPGQFTVLQAFNVLKETIVGYESFKFKKNSPFGGGGKERRRVCVWREGIVVPQSHQWGMTEKNLSNAYFIIHLIC